MLVQTPGSILMCYGQTLRPPAAWLNNKVSFVSLQSVYIGSRDGLRTGRYATLLLATRPVCTPSWMHLPCIHCMAKTSNH